MIDRLRQMAIFAKTMDHGSFRGAARELNLSPSVVSHHISQLEEHIGVALIYRSTRKLALTPDGERLLAATQKMLDAVEGELRGLTASASDPSGELRVTVPSVLSQSILVKKIADFSRSYPRIDLKLDFSDTRRELIDDHLDLAIRMGPKARTSATSRILFKVPRRIVAACAYLADQPLVKDPSDLKALDWIALMPVQNTAQVFRDRKGRKSTVKLDAHVTTNDAGSLYALARAGAGFAMVPEFLADDDVAAGAMTYLLADWELPGVDVFAEWPANAPKHGLTHLLLDALSVR